MYDMVCFYCLSVVLPKEQLPANVHLPFEHLSEDSFLVRLENIYDAGQPANVSLLVREGREREGISHNKVDSLCMSNMY